MGGVARAEQEHRRFLAGLSRRIKDFDRFHNLLGVLNMKVSARNHLRGVVSAITPGAVNAEVRLDINGASLIAIVTNESVQALGLAVGVEAFALIKAAHVFRRLLLFAHGLSSRPCQILMTKTSSSKTA